MNLRSNSNCNFILEIIQKYDYDYESDFINVYSKLLYIIIAIVIILALSATALFANAKHAYSMNVLLNANNSNSTIYPFQETHFTVQLNNTGSEYIKNMAVGFYLNHSLINSYNVSLPAHKGASISINYTYNSSGIYNFEVIANPALIMNFTNNSVTKQSMTFTVNTPQAPEVPSSIPTNNIKYMETFSIYRQGVSAVPFTATKFSSPSFFNNIVFSSNTLAVTVYDLSRHIALMDGLYTEYNNNTSAYSAWLAGNINPKFINVVLGTFPQVSIKNYSRGVSIAKISNSTSLCLFYNEGWTKIIGYDNNSASSSTCASIIGNTYDTYGYNSIIKSFNNTVFNKNNGKLVYTNTSSIGKISIYSNSSFGFFNIFDSRFGTFASYIGKNNAPLSKFNNTCNGILFNINNSHICSYFIEPNDKTFNFTIINSTEFTKNYTFSIYSIVNNNISLLASQNAQDLINALKFNETGLKWKSTNTCALDSNAISCSYYNFNYLNSSAQLAFSNNLANAIKINTVDCYNPGLEANESINRTIAPFNSVILSMSCKGISPEILPINSYNVTVNYTVSNTIHILNGVFNLTNRIG